MELNSSDAVPLTNGRVKTEGAAEIAAQYAAPGYRPTDFAIPDSFYRGDMLWSKGIGLDCCYVGVAFLRDVGKATCVFDPFCGIGTVLSMANALGVDSYGIDLSAKRCRKARRLSMGAHMLDSVESMLKNISVHDSRREN